MAIDPSTSAFSPINLEQLAQMEQVTDATVEEMARAEQEINDALSIAEGEAEQINTEPNSPRLPEPNSKLVSEGATPDSQISALLKLSNSELGELFDTLPESQALINAGIDAETIGEHFKAVLENNPGSPYSAEHLAKRALGELMAKQLAENPTPELEQAWFTLRFEMLSNVSPQAKVLINLIKNQLIAKGMSPEEAQLQAEKMVVTYVDGELSKGGVVTPFYGMHPNMGTAVNAILAKNIDKIANFSPEEFAAFLENLGNASELLVKNLGKALEIEKSGAAGKTPEAELKDLVSFINEGDSLMGEINGLLEGLPDFPGKVAMLEMMKYISELLANFEKDLKEIEEMDAKQKKIDTEARLTATKDRVTNILKKLAEAQRKINEARDKAESMKASMGILSVIGDVIAGIMMAVMGALLIAITGIFLAAMVAVFGMSTVLMIAELGFVVGGGTLFIILNIIFIVLALLLAVTIGGAIIVILIALIVDIVMVVAGILFQALILAITVVMLLVWVVIFIAWLAVFMITAIVVASFAITKCDNVTDAMVDAIGPAMMEMLKKIGIEVEDMDVIYMIVTVLPIVLVVALVVLPLILLIALPIVMGVVITAATLLTPILALVILVVMVALVTVLSLVWGPVLGAINAMLATLAYTALAVLLTLVVVLLIPIVALIVAIILALVIMILGGVIAALLPAIILLMLQWLPMFFAKSGLIGKMAKGLGDAFGMSDEDVETLEQILYGLNAGMTAAAGMQVQQSHYSQGAQGEVDEDESGFDEGENAYQMEKVEKQIKKLEEYITRFGGKSGLSAEEIGRKRRKEEELIDSSDAIQELIKIMKQILTILRKAMAGVKTSGDMPTAGQQGEAAKAVLGDLTGQSMNMLAESLGQIMDPSVVESFQTNAKTNAHGGHGLVNTVTGMMENMMPTNEALKPYIDADNERYYGIEEDEDDLKKELTSVGQIFG